MAILTNQTLQYLEGRKEYLTKHLNNGYKPFKHMVETDLIANAKQIEEATNRHIVGYDVTDNAIAYVVDYGNDQFSLYVEGKPSGWIFNKFELTIGRHLDVIYDGGTNWTGRIIIKLSI